jgi:hypothetical protein
MFAYECVIFVVETLGLCPPPDPDDDLQDGSTIDVLKDPIPELFNVLTEQPDIEKRWTTFSHPAHHDVLLYRPNHGILDLSKGKVCQIAAISQKLQIRLIYKQSSRNPGPYLVKGLHTQVSVKCQCYEVHGDGCMFCMGIYFITESVF